MRSRGSNWLNSSSESRSVSSVLLRPCPDVNTGGLGARRTAIGVTARAQSLGEGGGEAPESPLLDSECGGEAYAASTPSFVDR